VKERFFHSFKLFDRVEMSERQIETGQVIDARMALRETRAKYGL